MESRWPLSLGDVEALIASGSLEELRERLSGVHAEDVAGLVEYLSPVDGAVLLSAMEASETGEVLAEMAEPAREDVLGKMTTASIVKAVELLAADDAADVIGVLDETQRSEVLEDLEDPEPVEQLLAYSEDSAGGIMTPELASVPVAASVAESLQRLRDAAPYHDDFFALYAVDAADRLVGKVALNRLVSARPESPVAALVEPLEATCPPHMDQEEVAALMARYNLVAIPVVDRSGRLLGRVTFDDVIDVIEQEATEDILRMAGSDQREISERSIVKIARVRLPWVFVGLAGGLLSGIFMSGFESVFENVLGVIFFVPAVAALGGNVGIQSSTIVIRGITTGDFGVEGFTGPLIREIRVGLLVGFVCGLAAGLMALLWLNDPGLGLIVGLSLWGAALIAALVGAGLPFLLHRLGVDPAVATGPFITTANDVLGILLYFSLARLLMGLVRGA